MKQRIIKQLDILAHTPQESGYLDKLLGRDGITHDIDTLKKQAAEQLYTLLHDFSGFNISTIDRFFQQITRAFMHEIGYSGGYNIELDSTHVLTEAVDNLFFDLEKKENKELLKWLVDYARQQVEEDSYKNFRKKIDELAGEIFKEEFKSQSETLEKKLQDKQFLSRFIGALDKKKRAFEKQVRERAEAALTLLSANGLSPEDFKYGNKSGVMTLRKWINGNYTQQPSDRFLQIADDEVTKWYTKSKTPADISDAMTRIETTLRGPLPGNHLPIRHTLQRVSVGTPHKKIPLHAGYHQRHRKPHTRISKRTRDSPAFRYQRFVAKNNPARRHAVRL